MIDIELLESPLNASERRELGEMDVELDRIISLAERSQHIAAAEQAEKLFRERVYDVRILGFYLFGAFLQQGIPLLPRILSAAEVALTINLGKLGPEMNKLRHLDNALRWLLVSLIGQLRFEQRRQSEAWKQRLQQWEQSPQTLILQRIYSMAGLLESDFKNFTSKGHLLSLQTFLQTLPKGNLTASAATSPEGLQSPLKMPSNTSQESLAMEVETSTEELDDGSEAAPRIPAKAVPESPPAGIKLLELPLLPPMQTLLRKLQVFNHLAQVGKFRQATIVYKDLRQMIEHFDPRIYLPSLFLDFVDNTLTHAEELSQEMAKEEDFMGRALVELYQIDLDRFLLTKG
jgi:hypothetical protein